MNQRGVIRLRLSESLSRSEDVVAATRQLGALLTKRPELQALEAAIENAKDDCASPEEFQHVLAESLRQLAELLIGWGMPSIRILFELIYRDYFTLLGRGDDLEAMHVFVAQEHRETLRATLEPLFEDLIAWGESEEPADIYHAGLLQRSAKITRAVKRHIAATPAGSLKRTNVDQKVLAMYRARVENTSIARLGDELDQRHPDGDGRRQIREWLDYLDEILLIDPPSLDSAIVAKLQATVTRHLGE